LPGGHFRVRGSPRFFNWFFVFRGVCLVADGEGFDRGGFRPASGVPARGYKWESFQPGNTVASTHGAYSPIRLAPRAEELQAVIRGQLDAADAERFSLMVATAALTGAKMEAAFAAMLDPDDPASADRLSKDAGRWVRVWISCLKALGLTPEAARQASRDAGHRLLQEHIERVYVEGGGVDGG